MQPLQRTTARSARKLRPHLQRQQRRYESGGHGSHESHHAGSKSESFGSGFYIFLAAIPASFALYKFTRQGTDEQPYFTRLIANKYASYKEKFTQRNDMHTRMIEQAASDRVLFLNEANQSVRHVDLRFPEQFNFGAPWNVPAGNGYTNIDQVVEKYQKEANEQQEAKLQQLRENNVPRERKLEPLVKFTAGSSQ